MKRLIVGALAAVIAVSSFATGVPIQLIMGGTPVIGSPASFFYPTYFGNPGTGAVGKFNRIQIGVEALQTTDLIAGNQQTIQSWVQTYAPSLMSTSSIAVTSQIGTSAIGAAARSSDFRRWAGSASGGAAGIYGVGLNDDTTPSTTPIAGGVFGVSARLAGVNGITLNQMDVSNYGSVVDATPASGVTSGSTYAMGLTPGAYAAVNNSTAAMYVGGGLSTNAFRKGLIFFNGSLDTTVGDTGGGVAMEMGDSQAIRWMNSSGAKEAEIWGNSSGIAMTPPLGLASGGTGDVALTQFAVLLGNGTNGISGTLPGAAGTILASGGTSANPTFQAASSLGIASTSSSVSQFAGVTNGSSAAAGKVGEYIESLVSTNTALTTSNVNQNLTSISLTPGDWDVSGNAIFIGGAGAATYTFIFAGISTTSATAGLPIDSIQQALPFPASSNQYMTLPTKRMNITTTTTVFLVGSSIWSAGTMNYQCRLRARRVD